MFLVNFIRFNKTLLASNKSIAESNPEQAQIFKDLLYYIIVPINNYVNNDNKLLVEAYYNIFEKKKEFTPQESFEMFLTKRAAGAIKLAKSTKAKGGYSSLTAIHYQGKAKPYAHSKKISKDEDRNDIYKEKAKEVYEKLKDLDSLSQKEFQTLMGELEVWGEVYIRSTKPDSSKL